MLGQLERLHHLEQDVEPELAGGRPEIGQPDRLDGAGDEKHGIRPGLDRLGEHVRVDDEVLPEQRHLHCVPHRAEVIEAAPEPALLGEHADAPGPAIDVGARLVGGLGPADQPGGG